MIKYNYLTLPKSVQCRHGDRIKYVYDAHYYLNDHLGNHRIVMDASGTSMAESPRRTDQGIQPYKFGGKELDRFNTLDLYDFEARAFDLTLMWFTRPDPMAEKYYSVSPYAYCANNPENAIDPDGREITFSCEWEKDKDGKYVINKDGGRNLVGVIMNVTGKTINISGSKVNMAEAFSRNRNIRRTSHHMGIDDEESGWNIVDE